MKFVAAVTFLSLTWTVLCARIRIPPVEDVLTDTFQGIDDHSNHTEAAELLKRQSTTYWYENIAHQGISAFGPSGYVVYRNVKDYGATGMSRSPHNDFSGLSG